MSLVSLIKKFQNPLSKFRQRIYFTTPSHNLGKFKVPDIKKIIGSGFYKADFSEIVSYKNEKSPQELHIESQKNASAIYNSKATYYLTNGSTSGIIASMLSILKPNDEVLVARNCHKSVYSGLVLTCATPIWIFPEYNEKWDIYEAINPKNIELALEANKNIKAIIITNPTYEGVLSDIEKIVNIAKKYNVFLIIDEAHGALYKFDKTLGISGVDVDCDICIQSLHKTCGALNSSAIMHIGLNSKINISDIENSLSIINTTSPSFPILANIEATVNYLATKDGKKRILKLIDNINKFKKDLSKYENIHIFSKNNDITKILVKIDGLTGEELSQILIEEFNIEDELVTKKAVLFLCGLGTLGSNLEKLKKALIKIAKRQLSFDLEEYREEINVPQPYPIVKYPPYLLRLTNWDYKSKDVSINCVSNELIVPYPPGIPILIPGEVIQSWHIENIKEEKIKVLDI